MACLSTSLLRVRDLARILVFLVGVSGGILLCITLFSALRYSKAVGSGHTQIRWPLANGWSFTSSPDTHSKNEKYHKGEDVIAEELKSKVRVLCLVLTTKQTVNTTGAAVKSTWGKRCNSLVFVGSFEETTMPVVKLYAGTGNQKWAMIKSAFKHIYVNYLDRYDWVLRVQDNTFVVVENLRYLLSKYNATEPLYLGCRFKKFVKQGFMSGGAGFVLSKEAVRLMIHEGIAKEVCSMKDEGTEDVEMGRCMEKLNVVAVDTRDSLGRGRFFPFPPEKHLMPNGIDNKSWYWNMVYYPPNTGFNCCSDTAISFHGISDHSMVVLDYLVYHLRPYGISTHRPLNLTNINIVIK